MFHLSVTWTASKDGVRRLCLDCSECILRCVTCVRCVWRYILANVSPLWPTLVLTAGLFPLLHRYGEPSAPQCGPPVQGEDHCKYSDTSALIFVCFLGGNSSVFLHLLCRSSSYLSWGWYLTKNVHYLKQRREFH